jgi:signal transduction histidine kinase
LQGTLDRLRLEVVALRASRKRLVEAADADRRRIERELHNGVQQQLVALAVDLQLVEQLAERDPAAAKTRLQEVRRDVHQALEETAQLAQRISPPLLDTRGLAAAVRSAATNAGVVANVDVAPGATYGGEVAAAVYWCCLEALDVARPGARATVTIRNDGRAVLFDFALDAAHAEAEFERLRDRVEALGGRLAVESEPGGGTRVCGSFPVSDDSQPLSAR